MRILIVSEMSIPYAVGGGEVRYGLLARELARRGHQVSWLSMKQRECPDKETIEGVTHLHKGPRINKPPIRSIISMLRFMFTAFFHVISHRYDVVDVQTYAPLPMVWLACVLSGKKMIATIHDVSRKRDGQWMTYRFGRLISLIETLLYRLPYQSIIAVSHGTSDALVSRWHVEQSRIHVIPNGIDPTPSIESVSSRDIDLIFAGRFVPTKNIDHLVEISNLCIKTGTVRKIVLVGEGPLLGSIKKHVANLGLTDTIEFTGQKTNAEVLELLQRAKVFFHASSREGFPVVMVEAMACGTPVVAYAVPGVLDVVDQGITGLLVSEHDIEAHARACIELMTSDTRRSAMGMAGRTHVLESLTLKKMTDKIEAVYFG